MSVDPYKRPLPPSGRNSEHDWLGEDDPLAELARLVGHPDAVRSDRADDPYAADRQEPRFADIDPPGGWAEPNQDGLQQEPDLFDSEGPYDEFAYDQAPPAYADPHGDADPQGEDSRGGRRNGFLMVGAVLGVAILGTVAIAGYRFVAGSPQDGAPPVIKADTRPSKEVPQGADTTATAQNKQNYDRATDGGQQARVVEPEEPAERPAGQPRVIPTGPGGNTAANGQETTVGSDGVRRVRTFVVRPDGSVVDSAAAAADPGTAPSTPVAEATPPATPDIPAQTPTTPQSMDQLMAAASGEPETPPSEIRGASDGPSAGLSFVPGQQYGIMTEGPGSGSQTNTDPAAVMSGAVPMPAPRPVGIATASVTPAQQAGQPLVTQQGSNVAPAAPQQIAAAPMQAAPAARGGFVVQISSQRSEADARNTFAELQRRFPQILGQYQPSIQAANLGERGTYYRVRVGPFTSRDDATGLCSNLKTAGGDCVVQAN